MLMPLLAPGRRVREPATMPDLMQQVRPLRALELGVTWFESGAGGLERIYLDLLDALPGAGVEATGLVLGPDDVAARTDGRVQCFGRSGASLAERLWRVRGKGRAMLRSGRFDVLAAHFALFTMPLLDGLGDVPMVVHFHGPWADESAEEGGGPLAVRLKRMMERAVYRRAARIIVLSQSFGRLVQEQYGVPAHIIRQVPASVDVARFDTRATRAQARAQLGWPGDRRIILSVRRLARRMGLDALIAAMPQLVARQPDVLLMIAGRGYMAAALNAQVQALGLERHVRFLGFVPDADLPLAYRAAELNIVPSLALEGFGLTTVEALAAGTPSLVSSAGALPEVVRPLSPDLVFASLAPAEIAHTLLAALRGDIALPDAQACRSYVQSRFSAARSAAAVASVYREVV